MSVFSGVNEFKIEVIELSIAFTAYANKKTGKKVPNMAVKNSGHQCFFLIVEILLKPTNINTIPVMIIRKAPTCIGVSPINAFFIKMKELPQTIARIIR